MYSHLSGFKELLDFFLPKICDLELFIELFQKYHFPISEKSTADLKSILAKFKIIENLILIEKISQDNLQEQLKLAYIGLYHKTEQYQNDLLASMNPKESSKKEFKKHIESVCGFDPFEKDSLPEQLKEIRWICNQSKHNGPLHTSNRETPNKYLSLNVDEIKLSKLEFTSHCAFVREYFTTLLRVVLIIKTLKDIGEQKINEDNVFKGMIKNFYSLLEADLKIEVGRLKNI